MLHGQAMVSVSSPVHGIDGDRAVILVGNPANPYSRAIRVGRTLAANGYDVEIAAPIAAGAAELERDGPLVIRRYRPSGPFAALAATYRASPPRPVTPPARGPPSRA